MPAPPGSRPASSYARIIPAEELQGFESWQPDALGGAAAAARPLKPREPEPAAPSEADWQQRIAEARSAGYQDGYRDGLVGLEAFKQSHAAQVETQNAARLAGLLASFEDRWAALEEAMAQTLARSAVRLAREVMRHELQTSPQQVVSLAQEAVQTIVGSARRVELHLHPDDVPIVQPALAELLGSRGGRIVADPGVGRGGCRVQSDLSHVDATLAARWAEASAALGHAIPWDEDPPVAERSIAP